MIKNAVAIVLLLSMIFLTQCGNNLFEKSKQTITVYYIDSVVVYKNAYVMSWTEGILFFKDAEGNRITTNAFYKAVEEVKE